MIATDKEFKNLWKDKACLIIGSGKTRDYLPYNPDLNSFPGRIFGCNTAFRVGYRVDALFWIDSHVYKQNKEAIEALDCLKFSITATLHGTDYKDGINWIKAIQPERFSNSFDEGFYPVDLSGYLALNLAYIMGANPIYLYGFDSREHTYLAKHQRFVWAAEKARKDGRKIYSVNQNSVLCQDEESIFAYAEMPIPAKIKSKTESKTIKLLHLEKQEMEVINALDK